LQRRLDGGHHAFGEPVLQLEHIADVAVKAIGPDLRT
jgi:hypothetical protein